MSRYVTIGGEPDHDGVCRVEFHDDANVAAAVARAEARTHGQPWVVAVVLEDFLPPAEPDLSTAE